MNNVPALLNVAEEYGLSELKARYIVDGYLDVFDPSLIPEWDETAKSIVVTAEDQTDEMQRARELRLQIRQSRIAVENKRKELKESALREGKAIDTIGRVVRETFEGLEDHLKAQEEYAKRLQEQRERERREKAEALLREQEERERQQAEAKRQEEERKIREENARLKAEAVERERAAEEERAKQRAEHEAALRRQEAERQAERERHAAELAAAREEAARLAALVVCPNCGHEFDSREHAKERNT